jgi:uncharacterized membrane protein
MDAEVERDDSVVWGVARGKRCIIRRSQSQNSEIAATLSQIKEPHPRMVGSFLQRGGVWMNGKDEQQRINRMIHEYEKQTTLGDRVADKIASFGGSWKFILIFSSFLLFWLIWNVVSFTKHFDEPPYILLNLILSFVASFQAPIIMMSQNRQAARDKHESIIDFAINFKAEEEIDDIQAHLHRMEKQIEEIRQLLKNGEQNHENRTN